MQLILFLGLLVLFFIIGVGVPYAIGLTSLSVLIADRGIFELPYQIISQRMHYGINNFTLLAIPFFLLAGNLMNTGGITKKVFNFANELVGFLPGGLGHANVVASMIIAGMTGSAVAETSGLGTIGVSAMAERGFDRSRSAALIASAATIGPIIPPSIPLVVYGVSGDVSIAALLVGGIIPGVLMGLALMIMWFYYAKKYDYPRSHKPTLRGLWQAFCEAFWPLLTPIILIGGMLGGVFTPTEAAVVAAVYAFILSGIVYRELSFKSLYHVMLDTAKQTAVIMVIVGAAAVYGWLVMKARIPIVFMEKIFALTKEPLVILFIINGFLLIVGCFMETNAAILILTPIMLPLASQVGIDPVHLGLVMVLNLMIGLLTPPIGMCLYVMSRVTKIELVDLIKKVVPFYIPLLIVLILITVFPQLVLFLPRLLLKS